MKKLPKHAQQVDKFLSKFKGLKVGIFVDNSNLYYSQKNAGWKVDLERLKKLFGRYFKIQFYNFYIAVPKKSDVDYLSTIKFINQIKKYASVKTKPVKYIRTAVGYTRKGDVDVEIVLDIVRSIDKLDVIILVSGDSDYLELKNWVVKENKKQIIFAAFEGNIAWELRQCWHIYLNRIRKEIELKNKPRV